MNLTFNINNLKNNFFTFFYILVFLVMVSGSIDNSLDSIFNIMAIAVVMFSFVLILNKKKFSLIKIYFLFSALFILLYSLLNSDIFGSIVFEKSNYDSTLLAGLKFFLKLFILIGFFPIINDEIKLKLINFLSILIVFLFLQVFITTFIVNIINIPIENIRFIYPLIGGVSENEQYPLSWVKLFFNFEYYRPTFFFREPSGFGYAVVMIFFLRVLLGGENNRLILILAFSSIIITISKASIIIFISYFLTKFLTYNLKKNRITLLIILAIFLICFYILLINSFLGGYIIFRMAGLLDFKDFFQDVGFFPIGINSSLWTSFEEGSSRNFTFISIFYELGFIFGILYILLLIIIFFKLIYFRYEKFKDIFPVYIGFLVFLSSGNNYTSGAGLILLFLIVDECYKKSNFINNKIKY